MGHGTSRVLRRFTRQRDELCQLFRGEGGGGSRPWGIGETRLNPHCEWWSVGRFGFRKVEVGCGHAPPFAPRVHGGAGQAQALGNVRIRGAICRGSNRLGAPHQPLWTGLTPHEPFEDRTLWHGQGEGKRLGTGHG